MSQTTTKKRLTTRGTFLEVKPKSCKNPKPVAVDLREALKPVRIVLEPARAIADSKADDPVHCYLMSIGRYPLLTREQEIRLSKQIHHRLALIKIQQALSDEMGTSPSEQQWAAASGMSLEQLRGKLSQGKKAQDTLISCNLRLVVSVAKKYLIGRKSLMLLDLIGEGNQGLNQAAERFDHSKGYKFSTYAYWWIRQAITRAISNQDDMVRLPVHIQDTVNKLMKTKRRLEACSPGAAISLETIAMKAEVPLAKAREAMESFQYRSIASLENPVGNDKESELIDLVASEANVVEAVQQQICTEQVKALLDRLSPKQRQVIVLRFGLACIIHE